MSGHHEPVGERQGRQPAQDIWRDPAAARERLRASSAASPSRRYHDWYGGERRQSWATPPEFFAGLHEEFSFTLDGASEPGNGLLAEGEYG